MRSKTAPFSQGLFLFARVDVNYKRSCKYTKGDANLTKEAGFSDTGLQRAFM
jgi:hypothetical protein